MENLKKIYQTIVERNIEIDKEEKEFKSKNALQSLYGEITEKGVNQLIEELRNNNYINGTASFVDVGSGYGKMVFHMAMFDDIKHSKGIEFLKSKFKYSVDLLKSLSSSFPIHKIKLMFGDILDLKKLDEDIVYHNSISWNNKHMNHLINITKIGCIHISTNNLIYKTKRKDIKELHRWQINCSWNKNGKLTTMYVYKKLEK
tara:strand:+ start:374 stop:979 length:606 start_codon:yes stop_codon:yes gene_type:complete